MASSFFILFTTKKFSLKNEQSVFNILNERLAA